MRILVGLHHLGLGGSQLNAFDLALRMRSRGNEVGVFGVHSGEPGPMAQRAEAAGLPVWLARHRLERTRRAAPYRPAVVRALTAAAREHRADLVHAYEFPMILDAFHGPHRRLGVPLAGTVYAMAVPTWLPRYIPLVVGTQELVDQAARFRERPVLIEPPVDTDADDPAVVDGAAFRAAHQVPPGALLIVVVSRLEPDMKAEGILRAMRALTVLGDDRLVLAVAGDGPSLGDLVAEAERVNTELGRRAVFFTGRLDDPRAAYAAADIALGMGGSALRAMSFARPLVALGIKGFSLPVAPETVEHFLREGFYGIGAGDLGPAPLAAQLAELAADPDLRRERGQWSRQLVLDRFSLKRAADTLDDVYVRAVALPAGPALRRRESLRSAGRRVAAELLPRGMSTSLRRAAGWR